MARPIEKARAAWLAADAASRPASEASGPGCYSRPIGDQQSLRA